MAPAARTAAALVGLSLLGVAAAQALAPGDATGAVSPTVTAPTVSVPLPLPTVTVLPPPPTTPTVTLPPPPETTTTVAATLPAPTAPAAPSAPATAARSAPAGQPASSRSWSAGTSGGHESRGEPRRSEPRVSNVRARPIRAERSDRRGVVLVFRLSEPARVVFLVDGPTPACEVVARFPVAGREGVNRVRFFGVVEGRPLPAGTYFLRPRVGGPDGPGPRGVPVTVRNGERPSAVPGPRDARCSSVEGAALASGRLIRDAAPVTGGAAEGTRGAVREEREAEPPDTEERSGAPFGPFGPAGPPSEAETLPAALGLILLALGAASMLYIVVYVVRFLRHEN